MKDTGEYSHPEDSLRPHKHAHTIDAWRVFRIMAEFVDGFETMTSLGPSVAIFGATNPRPITPKYYELTERIVQKVVK